MASKAYSTLNGIAPSWSDDSITFEIAGAESIDDPGLTDISIKEDVEIDFEYAGGRIVATTTGQVKPEVSLKFYRSGLRRLLRAMMAIAPVVRGEKKAISLVHFNLLHRTSPPGESDIYQIKINSCRILGRAWALAQGPATQIVDVPVSVKEVVEIIDGVEVVLL